MMMPLNVLTKAPCESDVAASRRRFLQSATTVSLGTLSLTILGSAQAAEPEGTQEEQHPVPRYGFLIDTERCIGAGKCMLACRVENNVPEGNHRTWVERYVHFKDGTLQVDLVPEVGYAAEETPAIDPDLVERAYFVPKLCNQCDDAPCNQVCPVHASFTSPEGVELIDTQRCIGCAYCVQACPYGMRFMNARTGTADKCTWCYHRVTRGQQPACVEVCPTGARLFGRLDDPDSELRKRLAQVPTDVLKKHLGTHPKTRYVALPDEVI